MSQQVNRLLQDFYQQVVTEFCRTSQIPEGLVGPFLISRPNNYSDLAIRWMYVGQETLGWTTLTTPADVEQLMKDHADFNLAKGYSGAGSPFWSFAHTLDSELNSQGPARSFIWSNIARIGWAKDPGRVPDEYLDFWSRHRLLAKEVQLLVPQLVLFVTGPDYDDLLKREFPGIDLPMLSFAEPISRTSHPELPALSFTSYHPAFLRRHGLEKSVRDFVSARVAEVAKSAGMGSAG